MFWFDKKNEETVYIDIRKAEKGHDRNKSNHEVQPNIIMDNRMLGFSDNTFNLVVFDPPHMHSLGNGIFRRQYGALDFATWKYDLSVAFDECWRVLAKHGTLIFKWNEIEISHNDVLECFIEKPLFGTKYGNTIWSTFFKN